MMGRNWLRGYQGESYDRLRDPPAGVISTRKATFADIDMPIETPDPLTVVFKMKAVTPRCSSTSRRHGT